MARLGINVGYLFWQIVAFGILVFLMQRFLYEPVLNMLDKRAEKIKQGLADAEAARQRARASEKEYADKMAQARREANEIEQRIVADAQREHDAILAKARAEVEWMRAEAQQQLALERAQLLAEARKSAVNLAVDISRKVLGATVPLDEDVQRDLVRQFLQELEAYE